MRMEMRGPSFLRAWSLNGARFAGKSREEEARSLRWLRSLSDSDVDVPDVLCLQDFRVSLVSSLCALPYFCFVPMTNGWFFGQRELLGLCIASRWPMNAMEVEHTWGDGQIRDLQGVDEKNARTGDPLESDRLVLATQNRVVVASTVMVPGWPHGVRVATHHGFWTRDGASQAEQLESTKTAASFLQRQGLEHDGVLFMADFNPDKEGHVCQIYRDSGAKDFLPRSIRTTLAPEHPAARLGIRSDCVMAWPNAWGKMPFKAISVYVDPSPGSDHLLIKAEFMRAFNDSLSGWNEPMRKTTIAQ
ncbi:hypothetical protein [Edaphobacter albus]|uniref:hypothetical protein n=1 Tax=Edaphobacter sp. 4G125 TaxID=2763071 RepID=UPI001648C400|nr:hypothetical protein [Edaphobacter sp. 4G125]QNI35686.1 hypothetical protein H7846_11600 [Edaphobacter sp. 4G125]